MDNNIIVHKCTECGEIMRVPFQKGEVSHFRDCPKCQTLQHIVPIQQEVQNGNA